MIANAPTISQFLTAAFEERNRVFEDFFKTESIHIAETSREMARRFQAGGRLLAFGRGPYSTDAQHVSVEFVHPVIVGKRALPALDLSAAFWPWIEALVQPEDMVMGFGPPEGDLEVNVALETARAHNAMVVPLPTQCDMHPFLHQEMVEILYHTLWETVHVFLEHEGLGQDAGDAGFLYPFLGEQSGQDHLLADVAASIVGKVRDDAKLRCEVSRTQSYSIGTAVSAMHRALRRWKANPVWQRRLCDRRQ
jgi:D-sedoheptulose 7-phosphate isomerase